MTAIREYDLVALLEDVETEHFGTRAKITLPRGSMGTVVMELKGGEAFETEFADDQGRAYALLSLRPSQLLRLQHKDPSAAAAA